ncbi:MAG: glycosyltransferase family 39 protein [Planctomycetaceae bacterium]|nr:glycosyltransferase family 39 protein [Planctomycetaceae bacterium]
MGGFSSRDEAAHRPALTPAKVLAGILLLAFALRAAAAVYWESRLPPGEKFAFPDSYSYWTLGQALAAGEPYQFGSPDARLFRTPGYPLVLALVFRGAGGEASVLTARIVGALLGTCAVAGIYFLGKRLFGVRIGQVAAWLAAIYPGAIALSIFVLSEALFVPLMIAQFALLVVAWQASSRFRAALLAGAAGILAAGAVLARPSWLLFVPLAVALGLLVGPARMRQLELGSCVLAGLVLGMLPWWVRNARVTGHFVPTTLQVGASLYDGLNPRATGGSEMSFVSQFEREERASPSNERDGFEYRLDRRMRDAALRWAREHPGRVIELAGIKFARLWNLWPNEQDFRSWPLRLLVAATYLPALALGIWGAWRWGSQWPGMQCWLPALYFTMLHVVFVSSLRYREPAMVPLLVLAAAAVCGSNKGPPEGRQPGKGS